MGDRHFLEDLRASQDRHRRTLERAMPTILLGLDPAVAVDGTAHADELQLRLVARALIERHQEVLAGLELAQAAKSATRLTYALRGDRWVEPAAVHLRGVITDLVSDDGSWYATAGELSIDEMHAVQARELRGVLLVLEAADYLMNHPS